MEPRGDGGFGYYPIFLPDGNDKTWGEDPEYKDRTSHREQALSRLEKYLKSDKE